MIGRGGAAIAAGAIGATTLGSRPASAQDLLSADRYRNLNPNPLPKPIPGGVPLDPADPVGSLIHWYLPGPTDAVTPIIGLQGMGLDVEPSSITDFDGKTAFAVVAGEVETSDGPQLVEFDVRVMEGQYVAEDGTTNKAAFAFF